jgi:long-chain acyl-CoA synthetase
MSKHAGNATSGCHRLVPGGTVTDTDYTPRNLAQQWELSHELLGDHPSLAFEGTTFTSDQLFERATRVATGLHELGVRPGDRVIVLMANCPEVAITYHAIWRAGAAVTPVIFLVSAPELRHILEQSEAAAVITTPEWVPKVLEAAEGIRIPLVVLGDSPAEDPRLRDFRELEAAAPGALVDRGADELAALMFTGGTTGRSKGVPLTHENLWFAGWTSRQVSHQEGIRRAINALPLSHSYGVLVTVGALHATEPGFTVLLRWFIADQWVALAAEHKVQTSAVVPSMLGALLGQPLEDHDLSALTNLYSGAAPLPYEWVTEFERRVPSVRIMEGYGCTESSAIISATPPGQRRQGAVGRPVPHVEVKIVDDDRNDLATGEDGEIIVRGRNVMSGYWQDKETTAEAIRDGWLHTGDIGHFDADGYLYVVDRKKDLILRNGYNVYPRDVEDVLVQHPAVFAAACVGRPDDKVGEEVVAFVALDPGTSATAAELVEFTQGHLAKNKYPREVRIVDSIPLTPVGKIDRKQLRKGLIAEAVVPAPSGPAEDRLNAG